jgi:hydroxyacylglutathione hydrolase
MTGANTAKSGLKAAIVTVTPFQQNCTLIWDEASKVGAVVDPGGDLDLIEGAIKQAGVTIEKILLTHGHIDHAGGADELRAKLGVEIEGPHKADAILLDALEKQGQLYGVDGVRNVAPDRWLDEGDCVTVAGHSFQIFHCPGHSPGSVVFFNRAQKFALVGDVLFRGSIGRTDFPYGDHESLIASIKTKLFPLGDDITFICGHGPPGQFGAERKTNPFLI